MAPVIPAAPFMMAGTGLAKVQCVPCLPPTPHLGCSRMCKHSPQECCFLLQLSLLNSRWVCYKGACEQGLACAQVKN
jgi:hypothetical protein